MEIFHGIHRLRLPSALHLTQANPIAVMASFSLVILLVIAAVAVAASGRNHASSFPSQIGRGFITFSPHQLTVEGEWETRYPDGTVVRYKSKISGPPGSTLAARPRHPLPPAPPVIPPSASARQIPGFIRGEIEP